MNDAIRMQISAFVDGELPDNEADLLLRRMGQDVELRLKVAEYLAIGRALRGESSVPGVHRIHERVAAEIDDKPFEEDVETGGKPPAAAIRPLAGVAIAATVALLAIFGLQRAIVVDETDAGAMEETVAEVDSGYTVPQPVDEQLRQYYLIHSAAATEFGANGINSRFVTLRTSEEVLPEAAPEDEDAESSEISDESSTRP
ncbi:MAG: sigma-E factor negative regulatory protein [Woeseiaceae bacterium]